MIVTWRTLSRRQAHGAYFRELRGRVFHITSVDNFLAIARSGLIMHNHDKRLHQNGNYNSFFRNRKCVSFCDFANNSRPRKLREAALGKYNIFGQGDGEKSVFLFLSPAVHSKLIPWQQWKRENALSEMVVPYLESGYPGFVPLDEIEEVAFIHIPLSPAERNGIAALLAAARAARRQQAPNAV